MAESAIVDVDVAKVQELVPKALTILSNLLQLYQKAKSAEGGGGGGSRNIPPQEFIQAFRGISKNDIDWSIKLLKSINGGKHNNHHHHTTSQIINQKPIVATLSQTQELHPGDINTAKNVLKAIAKTTTTADQYPSADELLNTLEIKDPKTRQAFEAYYKTTIKQTKRTYKANPVDGNLFRWAKFGQFFFYGGIVIFILVVLRKMYEIFLDVTDAIRNAIADFIKPTGSRYYLSLVNFIKKHTRRKKKIGGGGGGGGIHVNINNDRGQFVEDVQDVQDVDQMMANITTTIPDEKVYVE